MADIDPIVVEARKRLNRAVEDESDLRIKAQRDLIFAFADDPKDQWDQKTLNERGNRPCNTYNRMWQAVNQVLNEERLARPAIKVRGVDDKSDPQLANVYNGLIRNIEALSDAETIYDDAFVYMVAGGFGYWRVLPEYDNDTDFNQNLYIRPVESQFSVYMDPAAKHPTKRDSDWCVLSVWVDKEKFKEEYGEDALNPFDGDDISDDWSNDDQIRIAEYYRKVTKKRELVELSDGRIHFRDDISEVLDDLEAEGITIKQSRQVDALEVEWRKINGAEVLEGPVTYRTQWIPVVRVVAQRIELGNREYVKGMTRDAKDSQRSYNYMRSDLAEDVLMRPKAPVFLATQTIEDKGLRQIWKSAHRVLTNYLPFKADPSLPGGGAPIPNTSTGLDAGKLGVIQQDLEDIKATTGFFDPSLGNQRESEISGKALLGWKDAARIGTFVFHDNHAKAIAQTGRIIVELIPIIYDTERVVRILGQDGTEEFVRINADLEEPEEEESRVRRIGNIAVAKFDVTVDTGPNYATQRQESTDRIIELGQSYPAIYEIAADIIAKGIDIPNSEELVKRLRKRLIVQGIIDPDLDDDDERKLADQLQEDSGQQQMVQLLLQSQAREADSQAAENMASVEAKRASALKTLQEAIGQAIENMVEQRRLRVDPDGILQAMLKNSTSRT